MSQQNSTFDGVGGTVQVDAAGALSGDGSVASPLAVKVDGVTVTIVGDALTAPSGGGGTIGGNVGATANRVVRTSGTSGATIQNSAVAIADTTGVISGTQGVTFAGPTSGTTALMPTDIASGTLTLPAATDTLVAKATTDTFTNKTYDTVGTGNVFKINGAQLNSLDSTLGITAGVLGVVGSGSIITILTADPGSPSNDTAWITRTGTSPGDTIEFKARVGGKTYELAGVTIS